MYTLAVQRDFVAQHFLVGMHKLYLPRRRRCLQVLKPGASLVDPEDRAADRNRAGRYNQHLVALAMQHRNVVRETFQPAAMHMTIGADQQRRSDLDDQAAIGFETEARHESGGELMASVE